MEERADIIEMTADIVSAYVSNSSVSMADLPALISQVHRALADIATGAQAQEAAPPATPAVPVKKSITPDGAFAKPADMSTVLAAVKPFLA